MLNEREAVAIESLFLAESHQASNPELIKRPNDQKVTKLRLRKKPSQLNPTSNKERDKS